jgi:hypothetical protein
VGNTFFAFGVISFLFALVIPLILKEEQMAELNLPL